MSAKSVTPKTDATDAPVQITFGEIPTVTRSATENKVNPYLDAVAQLAGSMGDNDRSAQAGSFTIPAVSFSDKSVALAQRLLNEAGKAVDVTVRKSLELNADGTVKITFWTKVRETRTRKTAK